jgi:hydrogenase/urease accessory protein HupE
VDLRLGQGGIEASVQASATDLTHDLPTVEPDMLLTPNGATAQGKTLTGTLLSRMMLTADGAVLSGQLRSIEPILDRKDVRLRLWFPYTREPKALHVHAKLFPYDPRHKTYVSIFQGGALERQAVLSKDEPELDFRAGTRQSIGSVVRQFVFEGIHHIFLGPDHILFIVGLLFLGGSLKQLLKIVTAFTIAHSITLALATLNILNPPARLIEPTIALSIVFVGLHSLLSRSKTDGIGDPRLLFAFCFGFIHGFGFANALHEMALPRYALGWSLFSFNVGVEIGQMCIVLAVAPVLSLIRRRSPLVGHRVVMTGSIGVILAGTFWFVQRAFFTL